MSWLRRVSWSGWRFVLFLVAIGVAGMHTTGHLGGDHSALPGAHSMAETSGEPVGHGGIGTVAVVTAQFTAIDAVALDSAGPGVGPMQMCLAIVSLTGLLLLVRLLWCRAVASVGALVSRSSRRLPAPRAPPVDAGLRIVEVSVLRI